MIVGLLIQRNKRLFGRCFLYKEFCEIPCFFINLYSSSLIVRKFLGKGIAFFALLLYALSHTSLLSGMEFANGKKNNIFILRIKDNAYFCRRIRDRKIMLCKFSSAKIFAAPESMSRSVQDFSRQVLTWSVEENPAFSKMNAFAKNNAFFAIAIFWAFFAFDAFASLADFAATAVALSLSLSLSLENGRLRRFWSLKTWT